MISKICRENILKEKGKKTSMKGDKEYNILQNIEWMNEWMIDWMINEWMNKRGEGKKL